MCYGNYNDRGRRPPYLNAVERNMLGWMDYPTPITASGSLTLPAIQNNTAYQFATANTGEYYILESRNGEKWDSYLSAGLLIYHVDKSERAILGSTTPAYLWENTNQINTIGGHPCIYLKKSSGNQYVFPGSGDVTSFIPQDWNGDDLGLSLTDIAFDGTQSSFTVTVTTQRTVFGVVKDSSGNPISGAEVSLTPSTGAFDAAPALLPTSIVCTTDAQGNYSLSLENSASEYQILVARKDGYVASCVNMTISSLFTEQDLLLLQQGEGNPADLCKYDNSKTLYKAGLGDGDIAIGMRYTAAELMAAGALGAKLSTVTFVSAAPTESTVYIVVNIGDEKTLRRDVSSQYTQGSWITVDVSDANITIPSGKDVFIGYGIKDVPDNSSNFYFYGYGFETTDFGEGYSCYDFLNNASSFTVEFGPSQYLGFTVSAELSRISEITFSTLGVSYIKLNGNTPEVAVAAGKSLKSTAWYLDGEAYAYNALPAKDTVATGTHVYKVVLTYYDGTKETVFYEFDKQ